MKISKKIPYTVYTILCVVLLLLLLSGIGLLTGFRRDAKHEFFHNDRNVTDEKSAVVKLDELSGSVDSVKIKCNFGKVTIQTTKQAPYIQYAKAGSFTTKTDVHGDVFEIELQSVSSGFDFLNKLFDDNSVIATVYLPDMLYDRVSVAASANDLTIKDIQARKMEVQLSAGDVLIEDCNITEMKSELNAGNFEFYAKKGIQKINSTVNAGNMDLYLPKNIDGFVCRYDVALGNFDNDSDFDIKGVDDGRIINGEGEFSYGDESCKITLKVSAGNIILDNYNV